MRHEIAQVTAWLDRLGAPPMGKAAKTEIAGAEVIGHGRDAKGYWLRREYYVPESYDDDDLSVTGFALPAQMGSTRRVVEIYDDDRDALIARLAELG